MARKFDSSGGKLITVSVVGFSGTEKEKGQLGVGKSCLCNRFVRSHADDYNVDHISVLSQSDFSGRVVNNDHFLYWGGASKELDDLEWQFQIVEQTEFVDDACFQPFKAGKTEAYTKRCVATKLQSAEKLMYVCKNQLGIEKEYEQRVLPDGRFVVDGFLCVYDVSSVPGRTWEKQNEVTATILLNIMKQKKPVVLVTSKNDEACEQGVREAERLVQRKEFKGSVPIVETSAHDNVNVEQAFILLAQMVDKAKTRIKVANYSEALRMRREKLDFVTEAFTQLVRQHVRDHKEMWSAISKKLCHHPEWIKFVEQFGNDGTQVVFRRHIRRLKEERAAGKLRKQLEKLPQVLSRLQLPTEDLQDGDWPAVVRQLRSHRDFSVYFVEGAADGALDSHSDRSDYEQNIQDTLPIGERGKRFQTMGIQQKIPYEILDTNEAAQVFRSYLHEAQEEQRNKEMCQQFRRLLEETSFITAGKQLCEVRVLLMGRECYEALSEQQQQKVYDQHQRRLLQTANHNLLELLLEHAELFYHFKSISPNGTVTQDDIKEITNVLQDDFRYKALDRMEQDRKLILFQHLGFVHCPMREHCPAGGNCLDSTLPVILNTRVGSLTSTSDSQCRAGPPAAPWALTADSTSINVVVLGVDGVASEFGKRLVAACDADGRLSVQDTMYTIRHTTVSDYDNMAIADRQPNGIFCVFQDQESFEYIRECAEKTLLSSLEQEDKLPFQGLPLVIMFIQDDAMDKKELMRLQEEGQNLADNLHCSYMEAAVGELGSEAFVCDALAELMRSNRDKASYAHLYRDLIVCIGQSDIRIMVCMFCGDPYSPERVLSPLLLHRACFLTGDRSIMIETFLGDSKRKIEVIISSYHGANQFREELIHGFILIYSAKRKASLATLNAFSMNIPNLPIQMVAVTDGGGSAASAFFSTDMGHAMLTDGNATADRLQAHFTTYTTSCETKSAFYTPFFREVWEKKEEIERAFRLEEPHNLPDVAAGRPSPPPRDTHFSSDRMGHKPTNSLDLLIGPERADVDCEYGDTVNNKNRGFLKGFSVYPPPSTPPEPAPPDHRLHADLSPDLNCSEDSLSTHESDGGGLWQPPNYGHRAFTTGRPRPHPPPPVRPRHSQTLKQPGKLDMNNYSLVSDALQHITIGPPPPPQGRERKTNAADAQSQHRAGWGPAAASARSTFRHHPSGVSSETELDTQYAQIKENSEYTEAQSSRARRHRRHPPAPHHQPSFSETDSSGSSEESCPAGGAARPPPRRRHLQPRQYKKRSLGNLVAVQSPRVPKLGMFVGPPELPTGYRARQHDEKAGSESSEASSDADSRRPRPLPPPPPIETTHKQQSPVCDYPSQEVSSAPDSRRRTSAWSKQDRRHKDSKANKDSKKNSTHSNAAPLQNWGPQGSHGVPLFVEKCVQYIEDEGLSSEGLYRVPGNRAHVDMLFKKFFEDPSVSLESLDVPVNAVATALKDFFSKKLPPLLDEQSMAQLEDIAAMRGSIAGGVELKDRSWRLLALRTLLNTRLSQPARNTLDFMFAHLTRVAENSKLNSMDSKNLAICWWPTLLPAEFSDMGRFEMTRPYLEDIVQTMIDQYPFLFRGQEAFVMV